MLTLLEKFKKRKPNAKIYGLGAFGQRGCPIAPSGPFRDSIRVFLQQCSEPEGYSVKGMPVWKTFLVHENRGFQVPLYTIEESVQHSLTPYCDHCRIAGWSHHFVSKRKYHMIIPVDDEWNEPLNEGVLALQTHLLHGLIHCNGFGHLIRINGSEGGSAYLSGEELMHLWDRICTNLHVRKISVRDVSKKGNMDFRLLHGVAYGHTWFGRWDYKFCNGSFGITQTKYEEAVDFVSSLELEEMMNYFRDSCLHTSFKRIIRYYQSLSETSLITIRDLLRFSLTLTSTVKFNKKSNCSKPFYQHLSRISNMAYRLENLTDIEVINKATEYWEILLKKILRNYAAAKASVQIILDTDCFAKAWVGESDQYICRLVSNFVDSGDDVQNGGVGEVIVLQLDSTVGDLKAEVRNAMRDTYFATENLEVTEIEGMEGVEDCKVLAPELVKHHFEIRFKGSCLEAPEVANNQGKSPPPPALNHQGDEKVRCKCGAMVDDGHRMIACDICHVWHHTRCNNIKDEMASPEAFICYMCVEN